jgi:hypothetical protein
MTEPSIVIGGGNWATKSGKLLGYSKKAGRYYPIPFDVVRAGKASFVNSNNQIEYAEENIARIDFSENKKDTHIRVDGLSEEKVINGNFSTDSEWAKGTGWTIRGGEANCDGTQTSASNLEQPKTLKVNTKYEVTITVSNYVSGIAYIVYGNTVNAGLINSNGTFRRNLSVGESLGNGKINIEANSSFTATIDNISVKEVIDVYIPRKDYKIGQGHILLEGQATNLIEYSEDFSNNYWLKQRLNVISNDAQSPKLDFTADKLVEDSSNNSHRVLVNAAITVVSGKKTASIFAKKGSRNWIRLLNNTLTGAYFDLENGIIGNASSNISAKITPLNNGWFRCSIAYTSTNTTDRLVVNIAQSNGVDSYQGDGVSNILIWAAQLEQGDLSTYIPTSEGTATRLAETLSKGGLSSLINSESGALYVNMAALSNDGTYRDLSISNGDINYQASLRFNTLFNRIEYRFYNRTIQSTLSHTLTDALEFNDIVITWALNDFQLWVNGDMKQSSSNGTVPLANKFDRLNFGNRVNTENLYAKVKTLAVYKEALTDAEIRGLKDQF